MMKNTRVHNSSLYNFSSKNHKGISSIIATLILLLLTIVLVGIVWAVVSGIVKTSSEGATSGAQCFNSAIDVTLASCTISGVGNCNVTFQRTLGTDTIGGVRLVFTNATSSSYYTDINGSLQTLVPLKTTVNTGIANITKIDAAVYYTNTAGTPNVCTPVSFTAIQLV